MDYAEARKRSHVMQGMVERLKQEVREVLVTNILPFWMDRMQDHEHGGFYGRIDGNNLLHKDADKGAILNARILWTFSAAYRVLGNQEYLEVAHRAKDYFLEHFIDHEYGGVYWSLDYKGQPKDTKKQFYAIAFAIYGLSEYARATGDNEALQQAIQLYCCIEEHALDPEHNGYIEAMTRDWQPISDMRLSTLDANYPKSQNTHLHILEAYTNLFRVWSSGRLGDWSSGRLGDWSSGHPLPSSLSTEGMAAAARPHGDACYQRDARNSKLYTLNSTLHKNSKLYTLHSKLSHLITIFTDKILNQETHHLDLFFDMDWTRGAGHIESYGHDIECSWLLHEAALVLGDKDILDKVEPIVKMVAKASEKGLNADGSMIHEANLSAGTIDDDRHWWVQAETVVGFINIYQHFHDPFALEKALHCWQYIKDNLIDHQNGEWYWSRHPDGSLNTLDDKAGFWKCPYHNSRLCLEIIERLSN